MAHSDHISTRYPGLGSKLGKRNLASLPTPVRSIDVVYRGKARQISVKYDNLSSDQYGGNKVRKLEYLLSPNTKKRIRRFATFGTVGSNHALACALYARFLGYDCTCFLAHQRKVATIAGILRAHLALGTDIVPYGGNYKTRINTLRDNLWGKDAWVVPAGGSSWLGTVGFVNAGLEIAAQIEQGQVDAPDRIYVASGTMGTAAGLALGLALAGLAVEVQAVRVSHESIANEQVLRLLIDKTAAMLRRLDESIPEDLPRRCSVTIRHAFFADGYARSNDEIDSAIDFAADALQLTLEPTYSGKAMAAVLRDLRKDRDDSRKFLFWNTYNSAPLPGAPGDAMDLSRLPSEFRSYLS
jgi:D-cysteine desulfhydrase